MSDEPSKPTDSVPLDSASEFPGIAEPDSSAPDSNSSGTPAKADERNRLEFELITASYYTSDSEAIRASIDEMAKDAALGYARAIECLFTSATYAANALSKLAETKPEIISAFARRKYNWPMLYSPSTAFSEKALEFINQIELGKDLPFDIRKLAKSDTLARQLVFEVLLNVDKIRRFRQLAARDKDPTSQSVQFSEFENRLGTLPPLIKPTHGLWLEACWEYIKMQTDGHPENHPELRKLGEYGNKEPAQVRNFIKTNVGRVISSVMHDD